MPAQASRRIYVSGECELDLGQREMRVRGAPAPLGGRAFEIVEVLVERAGALVTKDELFKRVWPNVVVLENTLQVHIASLRRALGPYKALLRTESGRGYRLLGTWTARDPNEDHNFGTEPQPPQVAIPCSNLPTAFGAVVGRAAADQLLRDLISAYRLVTLTGPGGIGKTTLSIEAARGLIQDFKDGVWLVELASLNEEALVPSAVASAIGLKLTGDAATPDTVAQEIARSNLLLIVDNCEHLIDAAARLIEAVIRFCPGVSVVATSREPLRVHGEQVLRVPPLDVPDPGRQDPEHVFARGAVELLVTRTRSLNPSFSPTDEDIPTLVTICRQLDGIPLAIEFAAARVATLGLRRVAAGLRDRLDLLTSGRRTALPRHRTLRAALDWSYELLPQSEQLFLCRLAVFPGSFTLEAAQAVAAPDDDGLEATECIASLVGKSLLTMEEGTSEPKWRLLETIRAYAAEHLALLGEDQEGSRRHATYFHNLIIPASTDSPSLSTLDRVLQYERELDDVRSALDWCFSTNGDAAIGVGLVAAFIPVWVHLSLVNECRARAEQALRVARSDTELSAALGSKLALAVALTLTLGPVEQTREVISKTRATAPEVDDLGSQLRTLWAQWSIEAISGEHGAALHVAQNFAEMARGQRDLNSAIISDRLLGTSMFRTGELSLARSHLRRVVRGDMTFSGNNDATRFHYGQRAMARANLAHVLGLQGFLEQADQEAETCLNEARSADAVISCWALLNGAFPVAMMRGDIGKANQAAATVADLGEKLDAALWKTVARCLRGRVLVAQGEYAEGTSLLVEGIDLCDQSTWGVCSLEILGDLARGLAGIGRLELAAERIEETLERAQRTGELWCQPRLLRIKGQVLLREKQELSEGCFRAAIALAEKQGAVFWELMAALALARLLGSRGDQAGAAQLLRPIYERIPEAADTRFVAAAKELIQAAPGPVSKPQTSTQNRTASLRIGSERGG